MRKNSLPKFGKAFCEVEFTHGNTKKTIDFFVLNQYTGDVIDAKRGQYGLHGWTITRFKRTPVK